MYGDRRNGLSGFGFMAKMKVMRLLARNGWGVTPMMRHMLTPLMLLAVLHTAALPQPGGVAVRINPMAHRTSEAKDHQGHESVSQTATLTNDAITYGLNYTSCWHASHGPGGAAGDTYLGMSQPTSANWYNGGFLRLRINGDDLGSAQLKELWCAETGPRGTVKLHFDHPQADVLISTLLFGQDDRLFVTIGLSPKTEVTSLSVSLLSYPSYFTYWNKREGDRKGMTATQTYPQADNKPVSLDPGAQWWVAFYDNVFDPAKGEGDGGCAAAWMPEQVTGAKIVVGSYACTADLTYKPDTRLLRLCFWDFNKQSNQSALARLAAILPQTREDLRILNPLPLAISGSDVERKTAAARAQLAGIPGARLLEQRLAQQTADIVRMRTELMEQQAADPATAEKALMEKLGAFEQLLWDVKFFVLIHG